MLWSVTGPGSACLILMHMRGMEKRCPASVLVKMREWRKTKTPGNPKQTFDGNGGVYSKIFSLLIGDNLFNQLVILLEDFNPCFHLVQPNFLLCIVRNLSIKDIEFFVNTFKSRPHFTGQ